MWGFADHEWEHEYTNGSCNAEYSCIRALFVVGTALLIVQVPFVAVELFLQGVLLMFANRQQKGVDLSVIERATQPVLEAVYVSPTELRHGDRTFSISASDTARLVRLRADWGARTARWTFYLGFIYFFSGLFHHLDSQYTVPYLQVLGLVLFIVGVLAFVVVRPIDVYAVSLETPTGLFNKRISRKTLLASTDPVIMGNVVAVINDALQTPTSAQKIVPIPAVVVTSAEVQFGSYFVRARNIKGTERSLSYPYSLKNRLTILALMLALLISDPVSLGPHLAANSVAAVAQGVFVAVLWVAIILNYWFNNYPTVNVDWIGIGTASIPIYASPYSNTATEEIKELILRPAPDAQQRSRSRLY